MVAVVGICAGAFSNHEVPDLKILGICPGASDSDYGLYSIEMEKFISVETDRRHAHSVAHHAYGFAIVSSGVSQHATHFVEAHGILQVFLGHEFDAQRVTRHDYGLGYSTAFCPDVGCGGIAFFHN